MSFSAYPLAHRVAAHVHAHLAREAVALAPDGGPPHAPLPAVEAITAAIDTAFWASLRREEGYAPRISLALLPYPRATCPLTFARRLPFTAVSLARLAPAVERPGIHLGVWGDGDDDGLALWGTTRQLPRLCLVLEVVAAGVLVLKYRREADGGKFVNVAVLEGDEVKIVDHGHGQPPGAPPLLAELLGLGAPADAPGHAADLMVQLAVSMRAHARGGTLLVVPAGDEWRESVVRSIPYPVAPAFGELSTLARAADTGADRAWTEACRLAVDAVGGLTAVDGATVMRRDFDVLAFGAKIARRRGYPQVEQVLASEPVHGSVAAAMTPSQLGGTRHLSAAQFVHDQPGTLALVASQDGRFTVFTGGAAGAVRAHRIEALLL